MAAQGPGVPLHRQGHPKIISLDAGLATDIALYEVATIRSRAS